MVVQYYQVLAFLLVTFWMEVLSLILITAIKFDCTHSTLLCVSEIGRQLCNFHSSVHTEQLISIIEVSQHRNRVALMWLICDNQCKLVQENPWTEPVLFNSVWWLNITPLSSTSAASGCSWTISQLPAPPHAIPLLSLRCSAHSLPGCPLAVFWSLYLLELPVTSYHDRKLWSERAGL